MAPGNAPAMVPQIVTGLPASAGGSYGIEGWSRARRSSAGGHRSRGCHTPGLRDGMGGSYGGIRDRPDHRGERGISAAGPSAPPPAAGHSVIRQGLHSTSRQPRRQAGPRRPRSERPRTASWMAREPQPFGREGRIVQLRTSPPTFSSAPLDPPSRQCGLPPRRGLPDHQMQHRPSAVRPPRLQRAVSSLPATPSGRLTPGLSDAAYASDTRAS